ncbi:hypothetical protein BDZ97DRAFT_807701 [Flammula alnicola]|nr:hypothetical protein BDZ97DRAFT_807701 [Flammula alnicola]
MSSPSPYPSSSRRAPAATSSPSSSSSSLSSSRRAPAPLTSMSSPSSSSLSSSRRAAACPTLPPSPYPYPTAAAAFLKNAMAVIQGKGQAQVALVQTLAPSRMWVWVEEAGRLILGLALSRVRRRARCLYRAVLPVFTAAGGCGRGGVVMRGRVLRALAWDGIPAAVRRGFLPAYRG